MSESAPGESASDGTISGTKKERFECKGCGDTFIAYPSQSEGWCSRDCYYGNLDLSGENNPNYSGGDVTVECVVCGDDYEVPPHKEDSTRYCSRECKGEWMSDNYQGDENPAIDADRPVGENHYAWKGGLVETECYACGTTVERKQFEYDRYENHFCSQACRAEIHAERFQGEDHPNWKENTSDDLFYRTRKWKDTRAKALERDGYECQACDDGESQLLVHHIIPRAEGGADYDLRNLVTLCRACHNEWEGLYLQPDTRHVE